MKTIEKIAISFNVFALYFAYNSFLGNSDTENRNYNFSLSIFVIVNGLIAFSFIRDFTFSKIVDNNFNHILAFDNSINHPENYIGSI